MATLVVFDFDESLVEANGFVHLAHRLFPEAYPRLAGPWASGQLSWPQLVNRFHELLAAERPQVSLDQIREAAASVPVHPKMLEAVRAAATLRGVDVKIVSDCATFYIDALLERHALSGCFSEVLTNPMRVHADNPDRLEMLPFHDEPHGCEHCAANMCKGRIIDQLLGDDKYSRVLYVGDGSGDYCPAMRLSATDVVFARSKKSSGETYELLAAINARPDSVVAQVVPWQTGEDIFLHFNRFLEEVIVSPPPAPVLPSASTSNKTLVVFDYDWSLINENSDTFIFKVLYPELLEQLRERRVTQPSWTRLMDDLLQQLVLDKPDISAEVIRQTVASVPILPRMLDAVRLAASQPGVTMAIVSDANTVYIDSMLKHYELSPLVAEVVTNPAAFEHVDQRSTLRVRPYHDDSLQPAHRCPLCPSNMCKGIILDRLRQEHNATRILYVGDGTGDYCPATRMTSNDTVFARDDDADGKAYGLLKKIRANPESIRASVIPWRSGEDIFNGFSALLQ